MFDSFATRHWFSREAREIWSDLATLQAWLDVEAALALTQAELGVVPAPAAKVIAERARAELFDLERLAHDIEFMQHPLVPVLHQFEALCGEPAAGYLHWGATTQNVFDTAIALQMKRSHAVLVRSLDATLAALSRLATAHRATPMAGRTHGQHALPMTFGFKVAGWMDELARDRERLQQRLAPSFPAFMGGAIGTFAASGAIGRQVETALAHRLGLAPSGLPLRSSFDRAADYLSTLGLLAGTAQKLAEDVVFMQRTEIGEASEAFHLGKVGSSTMAHKRNPSTALLVISLARMLKTRVPAAIEAMVRRDEGDSSATNVADALVPELAILAASVADGLQRLAEGLVVHPDAMQRNLALSNGLIVSEAVMMRLTERMGRHDAHRLVYAAAQQSQTEGLDFLAAIEARLVAEGHALPTELAGSLDPQAYVGESPSLTDETVSRLGDRARP